MEMKMTTKENQMVQSPWSRKIGNYVYIDGKIRIVDHPYYSYFHEKG